MPIYEDETTTRDKLYELRDKNKCKECGGRLDVFWDPTIGKAFLACRDWLRTHHEGIEREPSRYEMGGLSELNIPTRRSIMEKEHGSGMSKALDKARLPMSGALTQPQAEHILSLVYPGVPKDEIIRTAILCRDFGLHPLMKEVYIIGFKNRDGGVDYTTVVGITASRKMAADSKGAYSFLDGTPRAATQEEIVKQFGKSSEEERDNLISICRLKGEKGNEATGFGLWPKDKTPYGTDKGNTKRNMANIRSERPAYSRLPGGVLPPIEVIDEAYTELPDTSRIIDKSTGEIIEGEAKLITEETAAPTAAELKKADLGTCPIHNIPLVAGKGNFPPYCPTRVDGTGRSAGKKVWCKGKPLAQADETLAEEPLPGQEEQVITSAEVGKVEDVLDEPGLAEENVGLITKAWLIESLKTLRGKKLTAWSEGNLLGYMKITYTLEAETVMECAAKLDKGQAAHFVKKVQETLDMA